MRRYFPRSVTPLALGTALVLGAATHARAQEGRDAPRPKSHVELLANVAEVVPGEPFDIALRFELPKGWHTYWVNSGDSGQPPRVTWALPPGFDVGQLQFPVPKRHIAAGDVVTNILEGQPILLAHVTPPDSIVEPEVLLKAEISYLICKTTCLIEQTTVQLGLPVGPPATDAPPDNAELFDVARMLLPKDESQQLSLTAATDPPQLAPGRPFRLVLDVDIKPGFHMQSHEPTRKEFIKCDAFLQQVEGVTFTGCSYPPPRFRELPYVGKVSEYVGRIKVHIEGRAEPDAVAGPRQFDGLLRHQLCDDKGTCLPPDALTFSASASIVGDTPAVAAGADGSDPSAATGQMVTDTVSDDSAAGTEEAAAVEPIGGEQVGGLLGRFGLVGLLVACFLYGLFINATPCVLPVLSIKVLGFVQQAHESRRRTLALGLAFGAGVMVLFVILGLLAGTGRNVLQYPAAVIALGAVVTALALSMLGVYTLQVPTAAAKLEQNLQKEGLLTSFGKGALAPVLGFACTGPLLAGAFGWATQQPPHIAIIAFLFAGLGMASPYMLLGANPQWLSFVPKPGPWMITFERIMGFLLLAMVVLLLHPLVTLIGAQGLQWTLVFLVAVAMACWLIGQINLSMSTVRRWAYRVGAVGFVLLTGGVVYGWVYPLDEADPAPDPETYLNLPAELEALANGENGFCPIDWTLWDPRTADESLREGDDRFVDFTAAYCMVCERAKEAAWGKGIPWQRWSPEAVDTAVRSDKMVFVDFTAAYCTQCKANKVAAINTKEVRDKMRSLNVVPFRGDFTDGDREIFQILRDHDRPGVPLNLIYPAGRPDDPMVLKPRLTKDYLLEQLDKAAQQAAPANGSS
jgi:thiol:disulfide interchange protein DsbD